MPFKTFYNETLDLNVVGMELADDIIKATEPIIEKFVNRGYSPREIEQIASQEIYIKCLAHILDMRDKAIREKWTHDK